MPMLVVLRKATAAAHYVMGGPTANNTNAFTLGTPTTEVYVMHGETAAAASFARRLVKEQDAGNDLQPVVDQMNQLARQYHEHSRPEYCARRGFVDEMVRFEVASRMGATAGLVPPAFLWYRHCGYQENWSRAAWSDPSMKRSFDEYMQEAMEKGWWTGVDRPAEDTPPQGRRGPPSGLLLNGAQAPAECTRTKRSQMPATWRAL